jgi:hypothetical protein
MRIDAHVISRGTPRPLTHNQPFRWGQAGLASYRHVECLAFALPRFHYPVDATTTFIFSSLSAYQSFCQQRKEE